MELNLKDMAIKDRKVAKNGDLRIVLLIKELDYSPEDYHVIDNAFRNELAVDITLRDGIESTPPIYADPNTGEVTPL